MAAKTRVQCYHDVPDWHCASAGAVLAMIASRPGGPQCLDRLAGEYMGYQRARHEADTALHAVVGKLAEHVDASFGRHAHRVGSLLAAFATRAPARAGRRRATRPVPGADAALQIAADRVVPMIDRIDRRKREIAAELQRLVPKRVRRRIAAAMRQLGLRWQHEEPDPDFWLPGLLILLNHWRQQVREFRKWNPLRAGAAKSARAGRGTRAGHAAAHHRTGKARGTAVSAPGEGGACDPPRR